MSVLRGVLASGVVALAYACAAAAHAKARPSPESCDVRVLRQWPLMLDDSTRIAIWPTSIAARDGETFFTGWPTWTWVRETDGPGMFSVGVTLDRERRPRLVPKPDVEGVIAVIRVSALGDHSWGALFIVRDSAGAYESLPARLWYAEYRERAWTPPTLVGSFGIQSFDERMIASLMNVGDNLYFALSLRLENENKAAIARIRRLAGRWVVDTLPITGSTAPRGAQLVLDAVSRQPVPLAIGDARSPSRDIMYVGVPEDDGMSMRPDSSYRARAAGSALRNSMLTRTASWAQGQVVSRTTYDSLAGVVLDLRLGSEFRLFHIKVTEGFGLTQMLMGNRRGVVLWLAGDDSRGDSLSFAVTNSGVGLHTGSLPIPADMFRAVATFTSDTTARVLSNSVSLLPVGAMVVRSVITDLQVVCR